MRWGICWKPRKQFSWIAPAPTLRSFQALRAIGITDVRMTYDPKLAELFAVDLKNATDAGLKVNANMGAVWRLPWELTTSPPIRPSEQEVEAQAFDLATQFGHLVDSYSFDNEPGGNPWMAQDISRGGSVDFMRDVYMPACVGFVKGVRRVYPNAIIGGCDADSVDIQKRYIEQANFALGSEQQIGIDVCDRRRVHPYGELGNLRYATMAGDEENEGFSTLPDARPLDVGEIDIQQLPSAILRGKQGGDRGIATDDELHALLGFVRMIHEKYPDVGQIDFGTAEYFFTRIPIWTAPVKQTETWSTWTHGDDGPVVSPIGYEFAALFTSINTYTDGGLRPAGGQTGRHPGRRT